MPIWLTEQEYATLRAACAQMLPSDQGAPGAEEAGVADYIDGFLGAFTFDPPRIWAGGPDLGEARAATHGFATFIPLSRLDELAWRMRIEGSQGLPEREFNGPVVGTAAAVPRRPRRIGRRLHRRPTGRSNAAACGPTRRSATCCGSTAARACTAHRSTGATATPSGGPTSATRATCNLAATAMRRSRDHEHHDGGRAHHRVRTGRCHRSRGADPSRMVGRDHGERPQPPPRPRRPDQADGGLLQRRDQVHLALLPRA